MAEEFAVWGDDPDVAVGDEHHDGLASVAAPMPMWWSRLWWRMVTAVLVDFVVADAVVRAGIDVGGVGLESGVEGFGGGAPAKCAVGPGCCSGRRRVELGL